MRMSRLSGLMLGLMCLTLGVSAMADTPTLPTPDNSGYVNAGATFATSLQSLVTGLAPFMAIALVIVISPFILRKIVKSFAKS